MRILSPLSRILTALLGTTLPAAAFQVPHAGEDRTVQAGEEVRLAGSIEDHSPLDFWMADGNGATENKLIRYHSLEGLSSIGPLHRLNGDTMGWPGDLIRIEGRVYGIDVGARYVYIVDVDTGICLPVTPKLSKRWGGIQSLAYDAESDELYAIDTNAGQLLSIARGTGRVREIAAPGLQGRRGLRSLAFHAELGLLFAADYARNELLVIDPKTGLVGDRMPLPDRRRSRVEELQFFQGELYALFGLLERGELVGAQLQRIDIRRGHVWRVGPSIPEVSAHALLINSVPEDYYWAQVEGPAVAAIDYTRELDSAVTFPEPGVYAFELRVGEAVDRVTIEVLGEELGEEQSSRAVGWRALHGGGELRFFPGPAPERHPVLLAPGRGGAADTLPVLIGRTAFVARAVRTAPRLRRPLLTVLRGELAWEPLQRAVRSTTWAGHSLELQLWDRAVATDCGTPLPLSGARVAATH